MTTKSSYFCTACDRHYWTLRGVTRHIVRVHDGNADADCWDDARRTAAVVVHPRVGCVDTRKPIPDGNPGLLRFLAEIT